MMEFTDQKIAVLAGGISSEREVSLKSGAAVHKALSSKGLDCVLIDATERAVEQVREAEAGLVFIALHGSFGEDGRIQALLDEAGIPYTGSGPEACRRSMDKEVSRELFVRAGLLEPSWRVLRDPGSKVPAGMEFPLFVKPCRGGSSIGVTQVRSARDWEPALVAAFKEDEKVMVETKITGREMAVGILGDHALSAIEIRPAREFYDYTAKYTNSGTQYVFPDYLSETVLRRIQRTALKAHLALGCAGFSRVDLIVTDAADFVLEVNAIPGLTETSLLPKQALREGIQFPDLCVMMIAESLRSRGLNKK